MKGDPVFWFMKNEPGTTAIHFTTNSQRTLCGIDCRGWYGEDIRPNETVLDVVDCKRCEQAIRKAKKAVGETDD